MKKQFGFTLIEVAIVMVIIGFMLASLLGPLGNRMEQSKIEQTSKQIDDILEAIYGFAVINGRLPCPDIDGDGLEDTCSAGTNETGEVPWITLGTTQFDAWGNNPATSFRSFTLSVDGDFADTAADADTTDNTVSCTNIDSTLSFEICSMGNITVNDAAGVVRAQNVPAVVFSPGKPRDPSVVIPNENENTDSDTTFVSDDFRPENAPAPFNDIVRWIPTNVLIGKMVQAQRLP